MWVRERKRNVKRTKVNKRGNGKIVKGKEQERNGVKKKVTVMNVKEHKDEEKERQRGGIEKKSKRERTREQG